MHGNSLAPLPVHLCQVEVKLPSGWKKQVKVRGISKEPADRLMFHNEKEQRWVRVHGGAVPCTQPLQ